MKQSVTAGNIGRLEPTNATTNFAVGVVATWSGTISTTTPNAIIVTNGPIAVKASVGTIGVAINLTTTVGIVNTGTATTVYGTLGVAQNATSIVTTGCAASTVCNGSLFTYLAPR